MAQPAKDLGNIAKGTSMARAALKILEEAWSNIRSNDKLGKTLFEVIGKLTKELHSDDQQNKNDALQASVRRQITARPGGPPSPAQGGAPPQPPPGPIPAPGAAPGPRGP
jgi:hypothetical protein